MPPTLPVRDLSDTPNQLPKSSRGEPGVGIAPTWERWAFIAIALFGVIFGGIVLQRSAFSDRRRTDAGVFFRAGWAVRAGVNPYTVTDENDFYYLYPPAMAAAMVPLADPPPDPPLPPQKDPSTHVRAPGYLPYPVSIMLWYLLGAACVVLSVQCMCRSLELSAANPRVRAITRADGGWWNLRFWPLLAVLPDVGSTLSKGQVNTIVLACITGGLLLMVRAGARQRWWAGALLALAACIKVFPGIFAFEVLARRDRRTIFGYGACALICMILLPLGVFGPSKAIEYTEFFADRVLLSGLLGKETTLQSGSGWADTDNQAIAGALHNVMNINTARGQRPARPAAWVQPTHAIASLALLSITLMLGRGWRIGHWRTDSGLMTALRMSMLSCLMIAAVPMCHRHYAVFLYPALATLIFLSMQRSSLALPTGGGLGLAISVPLALGAAKFRQEGLLRDLPILLVITLTLWTMCAIALQRLARSTDRELNREVT